nr:MAG TPA: hypothetical protein [Caudoviricetes sp.]
MFSSKRVLLQHKAGGLVRTIPQVFHYSQKE